MLAVRRPATGCATARYVDSRATRCAAVRLIPLIAFACLARGCKKSAPPPQGGPMGPAEVTVVTLHAEKVALKTELPGRTTASLTSEVRPQITGIVKARTFEEGARVKAGQVLYQI